MSDLLVHASENDIDRLSRIASEPEVAMTRIWDLEVALRPFADAYRLFKAAGVGTKLPADVAGAVCMQDFARAAELLKE